jgi:hypothetical protein
MTSPSAPSSPTLVQTLMTSRRMTSLAAAAVLCAALVSCSAKTAFPSSSQMSASTPPTTPSPTLAPSVACTAPLVLAQVHQMLAGQDFEAHYLTIGDKFTLSVWLVDPEIDPAAPPSGLATADRQAMARALSISYQLVNRIACTQRVFDQVNPMIVDGRYQHWYRDFLPVAAFVGLHDPTTDELIAAVEAAGTALEEPRMTVPQAVEAPATSSCDWLQARAAIHAYLGAESNTAAYLIIGSRLVDQGNTAPNAPDDVGVEVQWPVANMADTADTFVRERLSHVAEAVACLSPAIDSLEAFVVDPEGRTVVYATVLGPIIRARAFPLPPSGIRLYRMRLPANP